MDDFFDMDPFELAFALGMAETIADEEIERFRIEREFEQDDEDDLFVPFFISGFLDVSNIKIINNI